MARKDWKKVKKGRFAGEKNIWKKGDVYLSVEEPYPNEWTVNLFDFDYANRLQKTLYHTRKSENQALAYAKKYMKSNGKKLKDVV